jgi:hypothetical protein
LIALAVLGGGGLLFAFFDPLQWPIFPKCLLHQWTGLHCPGCGGSRALEALTHGEVLTALRCNGLIVFAVPALGYWLWRGDTSQVRPGWIWLWVGLLLMFSVLRNIPAYPFSLLAPC